MKVKILYIIDGLEFGGGERGFAQIINGLPENRYETFLATGLQEALCNAVSHSSVQCYHVDFSSRYNLTLLPKLIRIIKKNQIDIVHGQGARAEFFGRLASGFSPKAKYVSTVQMPVDGYAVSPMKIVLYKMLDYISEQFVDRFIVVSTVLEKAMIRDHGIPRGKIIKIYNGIETDEYIPNAERLRSAEREIRREFELVKGAPVIGAIGRLVWQKGFEYLIRSIPALIQDIPNVKCILVGEGPLRIELERLAISLGLDDRLIFSGYRSDIREIMAAMEIVVIPSLLEGFPMITLEAMSMGKPIVTTTIDGILEQITHGREGLLVEPKNPRAIAQAVKHLVDDPDYALSLGMNARKKVVRGFSVNKMIAETIGVYESL